MAHHRLVLLLALLLTIAAAVVASGLRVDNDLRSLLPAHHPVHRSLERLEAGFESTGSVDVVIRHGTREQRHAFARALVEAVSDDPLIADVEYRVRSEFFVEHALYYLSDEDMDALVERVDAWSHFELCSAQPGLCIRAPDPEAPGRLRAFVRDKQAQARARTEFADYLERDGVDALIVLIHPVGSSADLAFAREITDDVRAVGDELLARSGAPWSGSDLRWAAIGPYVVKADEHAAIRRDMVVSGIFGLLGVTTVLYLLFRSLRAVIALIAPLLCGVIWAAAATELTLGHLNTITSLIASVVMGMGIDAGIHLLLRVRHERRAHDEREALRRAFVGLIVPMLVASGTTLGAFVVMACSSFPAFREFGVIALLGVSLCVLAMVTVFPALLCLMGVAPPRTKGHARGYGRVAAAVVARPGLLFLALVVVSVAATPAATRVAFETNGRMLQSVARRGFVAENRALINETFGHEIHAGVLVVDSLDQARAVLERGAAERQRRRASGEHEWVHRLFGAPTLLPDPAIDRTARAAQIEALAADLPDATWDKLAARRAAEDASGDGDGDDDAVDDDADDEDALSPAEARQLEAMFKAEPVTLARLPETLRRRVQSEVGTFAVYAYPSFDAAEILNGVAYAAETSAYVPPALAGPGGALAGRVFVGETTVYAAMYQMMIEEAPLVLAAAGALVTLLVLVQVRSLAVTVITVLPLMLGLWWLVAVMGLFDVRFTLFNIPILPAIVGVGVDNGVYLSDRIRRLRGQPGAVARGLHETGAAILAATATTALGFASFILADNGGLHGIGVLAVLGIVSAALVAVLVVPSLSALTSRRAHRT